MIRVYLQLKFCVEGLHSDNVSSFSILFSIKISSIEPPLAKWSLVSDSIYPFQCSQYMPSFLPSIAAYLWACFATATSSSLLMLTARSCKEATSYTYEIGDLQNNKSENLLVHFAWLFMVGYLSWFVVTYKRVAWRLYSYYFINLWQ